MIRKALVVVFGDLNRSPRMRYHCESLAKNDYMVTTLSCAQSTSDKKICQDLGKYNQIHQKIIIDKIDFKRFVNSTLAYLLKTIWRSFLLICQLISISIPNVIIVQNPPSIPVLPILVVYSRLVRAKLIIDWHNYGYTILRLNYKHKPNHFMVRIYKFLEFKFGRLANSGFCVSKAMKNDLIEHFKINYPLEVLYDRPAKLFRPFDWCEKHDFLLKITKSIEEFKQLDSNTETEINSSAKSKAEPKANRPLLILSSTSWTADEDFGLLFSALQKYDKVAAEKAGDDEVRELVCVITGKGPMKEFWATEIKRHQFSHVQIVLPWLESHQDYASMVASSDLGISLHRSSSGLDLPMKVVDMFGCAIPVYAFDYKTIGELVMKDFYGETFSDDSELADLLINTSDNSLIKFRENLRGNFLRENNWDDNWNRIAKPVFDN